MLLCWRPTVFFFSVFCSFLASSAVLTQYLWPGLGLCLSWNVLNPLSTTLLVNVRCRSLNTSFYTPVAFRDLPLFCYCWLCGWLEISPYGVQYCFLALCCGVVSLVMFVEVLNASCKLNVCLSLNLENFVLMVSLNKFSTSWVFLGPSVLRTLQFGLWIVYQSWGHCGHAVHFLVCVQM